MNIGFKAGSYVKFRLSKIPKEFINNFDPCYPLIVASMNPLQITQCKVKSHIDLHLRQRKPLKSNILSLISVGWHRFQTAAIFCSQNEDRSMRYLKYTPKMVSCYISFTGYAYPQKTGLSLYSMNQNVIKINDHSVFKVFKHNITLNLVYLFFNLIY